MNLILCLLIVPVVMGLLAFIARPHAARAGIAVAGTLLNLLLALAVFSHVQAVGPIRGSLEWVGFGMDLAFAVGPMSSFVLAAAAGFAFLVAVYSWRFMEKHPHAGQFYLYVLLSVAMINGAMMADHLVALLFFWEGLLGTLFGMIAIGSGGAAAWKSATKALIMAGLCDLGMMLGIAIVGLINAGVEKGMLLSYLAEHHVSTGTGLGIAAFVLLMIGAVSKAGSMPFHTWIPDAAVDAPLPFVAFLPASLEKLLGIYFLTRITQGIFELKAGSALGIVMMLLGAGTILFAVAMALVQKDYKRMLSYSAISQVGYMVLGIGTALPIGIVGGVFHMINHATYKSCLFLTSGNVERQAGTTDLAKLGGLARNMPVTFICFVIAAASASGFPLTNAFYSKEMVYHAALEVHPLLYLAAALGTVLTAACFLKLGHAVFLGKRAEGMEKVKEAPVAMWLPAAILAAGCLLFGLGNVIPLHNMVQPALAHVIGEEDFAAVLPEGATGWLLTAGTVLAISLALFNHLRGAKKAGSALGAVDHIRHAPVLSNIYDLAEAGYFDPYRWMMAGAEWFGRVGNEVNKANDWLYESMAVAFTRTTSWSVRAVNTGNVAIYVVWSLAGAAALIWFLLS